VAAAHEARDAGHLDRAVASYRDALRLWRGPALDGIDSQLVQAAASRLNEQRITTNEDRLAPGLPVNLQRLAPIAGSRRGRGHHRQGGVGKTKYCRARLLRRGRALR
jgi:hypothetical protein